MFRIALILAFVFACVPFELSAQSVAPEQIGLSQERLDDLTELLRRECAEGRIAGAVAAVSRHGRIGYLQAVGSSNLQTQQPMQNDALFRIASMTKAITSASVMSLVEDGALSLEDSVAEYLPAFNDGDAGEVPTIHDLLTHRSGLTYGWFGPKELDAVYRSQAINNLFEPTDETIGDRVERIATLPLKFSPGSQWDYGVSTDVLGRVVEVASGLTLDQFLRERFFRPLRMNDTFFYVPQEKQARLASLYTLNDNQQLEPVGSTPVQRAFFRFSADYCTVPGKFYSGGGGLVSSAGDYLRFLHMLLRGGELDGVRVLTRESVATMTRNQIGEMKIYLPGHGDGFGFGFGVVTAQGADSTEFSEGSYSWGGIFNTYFWVDPQEELIGLLMTQVFPNDHTTIRDDFRRLAYAAIDDSGFEKIYLYQPGDQHANPHFNGRQLRVNAAEVSTHETFASRSEPRSSGMARIRVDEDLRTTRCVHLDLAVWGGHPGTANKRVTINGRSTHLLPQVGTEEHHCTHQFPSFNLRPIDLVNGYNSLQFACDTGDTFWGHYIVDRAALRIGLSEDDQRLVDSKLAGFHASVVADALTDREGYRLRLEVPDAMRGRIQATHFEACFVGYDANGDGRRTDWQSCGTELMTDMLPAQRQLRFRAVVEFKDVPGLQYRTPVSQDYAIAERAEETVRLVASSEVPAPFWSRANKVKECEILLNVDPKDILSAELHVVAWAGGAGSVADYFTLNGRHLPIAEGDGHDTVYSRLPIDPDFLRTGANKIVLRSDTEHHGIEILLPGPALMIRYKKEAGSEGSQ